MVTILYVSHQRNHAGHAGSCLDFAKQTSQTSPVRREGHRPLYFPPFFERRFVCLQLRASSTRCIPEQRVPGTALSETIRSFLCARSASTEGRPTASSFFLACAVREHGGGPRSPRLHRIYIHFKFETAHSPFPFELNQRGSDCLPAHLAIDRFDEELPAVSSSEP